MFSFYTSENKGYSDDFFLIPVFNIKEVPQYETVGFYKLCRSESFLKPASKYACSGKWSTSMVLNWTQLPQLVSNLGLAAEPVGCFRNQHAALVVDLTICMNRSKRERKLTWLLWRPTTKFLTLTWIKLFKMFHCITKKINSVIWTN